MKKYQIIRVTNGKGFYAIANKEDIKAYKDTHFLPYEYAMQYKKYLVELLEKKEIKKDVDLNTYYVY